MSWRIRGEPAELGVVEVEHLERVDLIADELARPVQLRGKLRFGGKSQLIGTSSVDWPATEFGPGISEAPR